MGGGGGDVGAYYDGDGEVPYMGAGPAAARSKTTMSLTYRTLRGGSQCARGAYSAFASKICRLRGFSAH